MGNEHIGLDVRQNKIALATPSKTFFQVGDYEPGFNEVDVLSRVAVANRDRFGIEIEAVDFLKAESRR